MAKGEQEIVTLNVIFDLLEEVAECCWGFVVLVLWCLVFFFVLFLGFLKVSLIKHLYFSHFSQFGVNKLSAKTFK